MDWINQLKTDENSALKDLYSQYKKSCLQWIMGEFNIKAHEASEIFQTSVIIFYDNYKRDKLEGFTGDILPYVKGIIRNKCMEYFRKKEKSGITVTDHILINHVAEEDSEDKIKLENDISRMTFCLEILGEPCRSVLKLFYYDDMDMRSIAALMGYKNVDSVKTQKYKCIRRLQNIFFGHNT
ncbi:MAG: sigma-70 family RNA polymerase sigma factor [Saprospiraceae bacterium]|nr:sigma-70 family RNA polymerase sigma factor [Saprospiraceae bacterium]